MKNLYVLQTLLVVLLSSVFSTWTYGQFAEPLVVNVRNTGSSFSDQFAASMDYTYLTVVHVNPSLGFSNLAQGASPNTLIVTFTPYVGVTGTTDLVISYYTLTAPMHPVTRAYRFIISDEIVITAPDDFVVDKGSSNIALDVLSNDSITSGQLLLKSISVSNAGVAEINGTGDTILFTPESDFEGDTWLQYIACDTSGNCGEGTIHILVRDSAILDHLVFEKFLLNTESLQLLAPFDGFDIEVLPSNGTLVPSGDFSWTYTPDDDYTGKDTFKISLDSSISRTYEITVYQKAFNVHARNDRFYVRPGLSVNFNVLNNDLLDYEVSSYTLPTRGSIIEVSNGVYTYTPNTGYRGIDKFTYKTCFQDTVYCETATVLIHVTDLEPDNVFSYNLQTSVDLPLAIDYPIEFTDFTYIISENPSHGELIFHQGLQEVNLPCDTIEAYNMLTYQPASGYSGTDHFEYYYCIDPSNLCYLVKVDINVVPEPESETCPCVIGCVWPGDADKDGRVDMSDLLTLGNSLGEAGPPRDYDVPSTWFGQHPNEWTIENSGVEYVDANGDGTITSGDVDLISEYYFKAHDIVAKDVQQKLPFQFSIIPVQYSLDSGDVVILDVAFGNGNYPVLDLKGAKFSVNLPPAMVDSASVDVQFHQDSWLAEGSPFISLGKVPWDGRIDAGFARAQGNGASGFGVIATIVFIIEDDLEGFKTGNGKIRIPVTISGGGAMDNAGNIYDVDGDEFILEFDLNQSNSLQYKLVLYPNPARDLVDIYLNGKTEIEAIQIFDPQGRVIQSFESINSKHHSLDISMLPAGLYYVQVKHTAGLSTQLLSVIR